MTSDRVLAVPTRDVAIIGMAARLPEADDVHEFLENLRGGRDSVRELSAERRRRTSMSLDAPYQVNGYIEDIDSFDHPFFGISPGEAQHMSPEHRLLLQVAYQAVESAGCDPTSLRDRRVSVYVGDTRLMYGRLARAVEPMMVMGTHVAATAGRISRFLRLRGPVAMVDSSCSSGLLAVHQAVNDLLLGDADMALACGVNLNLFGQLAGNENELDLGIRSADGKTRPFSADADGTGSGEAVVAVLLKPLDQALRDGDVIHAVIKGIAANNVAGRSTTLTAPDSEAQAEVIERAWARAGIDPTTISYIEAHGTATRLGDPIEIEAIDLAFGRVTDRKRFCAVSSVKSNVGHTWSVSGLVGLVKVVLALRSRQLFPNLHSRTLSPLIDFASSAVCVTQELMSWGPACGVRRAGVSSFGVMGTNVHAVLEEAPARLDGAPAPNAGGHWIPVSAKSATALRANVTALGRWLAERPELRIEDVQRTLVAGRAHCPYRACVTARDVAGLVAALAEFTGGSSAADVVTVLVLSGGQLPSPELVATFRRARPTFDLLYGQAERAAGDAAADPRVSRFAFQHAMHGLLRQVGLRFRHVVGAGPGRHAIDAGAGRIDLDEALRCVLGDPAAEPADVDARVDRLLTTLGAERPVLFVEAGPPGTVSAALAGRDGAGCTVVAVRERQDAWAAFLRDLYLGGALWNWPETAGGGRRIELPSYQFDRIRCWLDERNTVTTDAATVEPPAAVRARPADVLTSVLAIWEDVLGTTGLDPDTSFVDLGGDSISARQVLNRLRTAHGIELDPYALFDHETPRELARHIEEVLAAAAAPAEAAGDEAPPETTDSLPASPGQLHIWLASQLRGGSVAFNLVRAFELTGTVDRPALRVALDALAARHDGIRASFALVGEELRQRIAPKAGFSVPLELVPWEDRPAAADLAREFAARPFDLERGPLLRAQLASSDAGRHVLTLCTNHIVADGWSLGLLVRDLGWLYASIARGTALDLPEIGSAYRDYHLEEARRAQDRRDRAAAYWLGRFRETVPPLDLPAGSGAGGRRFGGACRRCSLPPDLWRRVKSFGQAEGGTAFTTVLSGFAASLSRHAPDGELVLGTSIAGRDRLAHEQVVGMLVRMLPLRLRADRGSSFQELHEQVRATLGDALRNGDYPCEELVQELQRRGLIQAPRVFDVVIELEQFGGSDQAPLAGMASDGLRVTPIEVTLETSVLPLDVMLAEHGGGLEATIRFDTGRFDGPTVDQLWQAFADLLEGALAEPAAPLERLAPPDEHERAPTAAPDHAPALPAGDGAGRTDQERAVVDIWQEVLGVDRIGVTDRFFEVGGNSLRAVKVLARVQARLGVKLRLETLFSRPTVGELAAAVAAARAPAVDPIASHGGPGVYDVARTQELLLEIERSSPERGAFHRNDLYELPGDLDPALLERSFALLVERHESLRTTYAVVDGRAAQVVHPAGELPLPFRFHDLSGHRAEAVDELVAGRIRQPFEIAEEPLVRADLIHAGEGRHLLVTSMHQLVSDGRSAAVLRRDWHELYEALAAGRAPELPELEIQYKDVAAWRNRRLTPEARAEHRRFWLRELAGAAPFASVPADRRRPAVSVLAGARLRLSPGRGLAERFAALALKHSVTELVVARCAVGVLLAGNGCADVVLGTYTLGRSRLDLEDQVGFHINTVPLRFRLLPGDDVGSILARTHREGLRAFQHEEYPYGQTMGDLGWERGPDRSPVFDVVVALDQLEAEPEDRPGPSRIRFVRRELPRRSKEADLQFAFLRSADGLEIALTYNTEVFSPGRAQGILDQLAMVVGALAAEQTIAEALEQAELRP